MIALFYCAAAASPSAELATILAAAHELRTSGSFADAEAAYRDAARQFPDRAEPLFFAGLAARAAGKQQVALEAYRAALAIDDLPEAHMNIASLLSSREDAPAEALRHYKKALALREWPASTAATAEFNAAIALQTLGGDKNIQSAISAAKRARKLDPTFAAASELIEELKADLASTVADEKEERAQEAADDSSGESDGSSQQKRQKSSVSARGQQQQQQQPDGSGGTAPEDEGASDANAHTLHAAAFSLRWAAQRALLDPAWPAAARKLQASGEGGGEGQLLAAVIADLSTLLTRLLEVEGASS